jgi:2-keto-4-pentenoate hydratase/2-oxohepta-3-ene-1,7-dioic acid hydratase in catechol pathway
MSAMKIYRFKHKDKVQYGILKEEILIPLKKSLSGGLREGKEEVPIGEVIVLPPVLPSKIVAVGRNYKEHADERGQQIPKRPLIFLKPPSAVIGSNDSIFYPEATKRLDYEGELAFVIKKKAWKLGENAETDDYILGYTCMNDVTARDLQDKDGQWTRAKSFDTFAPIGPCIATDIDPSRLRIKTFLNGKLRQSGNTANMIFPIPALLRYVSHIMTLLPGDIITTGTPSGVGPMSPGDRVDVQIEGIGTLSNRVMRVKS